MSLLQTLFLLGAVHGLFLAFTIWRKTRESIANRWLAIWMLCLVYLLGCAWLYLGDVLTDSIEYFAAIEFDLFLMGPLLYFYIRSIIAPDWRPGRRWLALFLPALLSLGLFVLFQFARLSILRIYYENAYLSFVSATIYLGLAIAALTKNRQKFLDWMYVRQRKAWVVSLLALYLVGWLVSIPLMTSFFWQGPTETSYKLLHSIIALNITAEIYLLGYFALSHPILFTDHTVEEPTPPSAAILQDEDTDGEYRRICELISRKVHRNPDLTLELFARKAGISPPSRVSQIIRKHEGKLFNDWLNGHRLTEFTTLLSQPAHHASSILELCYAAGFNSKATFYRVFKEKRGMSPLEYRKSLP